MRVYSNYVPVLGISIEPCFAYSFLAAVLRWLKPLQTYTFNQQTQSQTVSLPADLGHSGSSPDKRNVLLPFEEKEKKIT